VAVLKLLTAVACALLTVGTSALLTAVTSALLTVEALGLLAAVIHVVSVCAILSASGSNLDGAV
jgi:hypothetical protein